jgi:hypothetical protein
MNWVFLDVADIMRVQADLIDVYGGSHGLAMRAYWSLPSCGRRNKVNFDPDATVATVGASLSYGLYQESCLR